MKALAIAAALILATPEPGEIPDPYNPYDLTCCAKIAVFPTQRSPALSLLFPYHGGYVFFMAEGDETPIAAMDTAGNLFLRGRVFVDADPADLRRALEESGLR